jgi:predicted solute-binding protein
VNNYSVSLGNEGKKAIETLLKIYTKINTGENTTLVHFIE